MLTVFVAGLTSGSFEPTIWPVTGKGLGGASACRQPGKHQPGVSQRSQEGPAEPRTQYEVWTGQMLCPHTPGTRSLRPVNIRDSRVGMGSCVSVMLLRVVHFNLQVKRVRVSLSLLT